MIRLDLVIAKCVSYNGAGGANRLVDELDRLLDFLSDLIEFFLGVPATIVVVVAAILLLDISFQLFVFPDTNITTETNNLFISIRRLLCVFLTWARARITSRSFLSLTIRRQYSNCQRQEAEGQDNSHNRPLGR